MTKVTWYIVYMLRVVASAWSSLMLTGGLAALGSGCLAIAFQLALLQCLLQWLQTVLTHRQFCIVNCCHRKPQSMLRWVQQLQSPRQQWAASIKGSHAKTQMQQW